MGIIARTSTLTKSQASTNATAWKAPLDGNPTPMTSSVASRAAWAVVSAAVTASPGSMAMTPSSMGGRGATTAEGAACPAIPAASADSSVHQTMTAKAAVGNPYNTMHFTKAETVRIVIDRHHKPMQPIPAKKLKTIKDYQTITTKKVQAIIDYPIITVKKFQTIIDYQTIKVQIILQHKVQPMAFPETKDQSKLSIIDRRVQTFYATPGLPVCAVGRACPRL